MLGVLNKNTRAYFFQLLFLSLILLIILSSLNYQVYGFKNAFSMLIGGIFCLITPLILSLFHSLLLEFHLLILKNSRFRYLILNLSISVVYVISLLFLNNYLLIFIKPEASHFQNLISLNLGGLIVCFIIKILIHYSKDSYLYVRIYFLLHERLKQSESSVNLIFREISLFGEFIQLTFFTLTFFVAEDLLGVNIFNNWSYLLLTFLVLFIFFNLLKFFHEFIKNSLIISSSRKLSKNYLTLEKIKNLFILFEGLFKNIIVSVISYLYFEYFYTNYFRSINDKTISTLSFSILGIIILFIFLATLTFSLMNKINSSKKDLNLAFKRSRGTAAIDKFFLFDNIISSNLYVPLMIFFLSILSSFSIYLSLGRFSLYVAQGVYLGFIFTTLTFFILECYLKLSLRVNKGKKLTEGESLIYLQKVRIHLFLSSLSNLSFLTIFTNLFLFLFSMSGGK